MIFNNKNLKKTLQFLLIVFGTFALGQNTNSGVGIGTTNPQSSAILEVNADNLPANGKKGMLFPRVALQNRTDITTIPNPATGLMIFNTTDSPSDDLIKANMFYYWNGTSWIDLATSQTFETELYPQIYIVANRGTQAINKTNFNTGENTVVNFAEESTGAMSVNVGNRVQLSNNNFRILSGGRFEITGYIGYNPWVPVNCTTQSTESTCTAGLDLFVQVSTDNGSTWTNISKTSSIWGVGTGDRNRSVMIAPFVMNLTTNSLVRLAIGKGAITNNHGANGNLNIEPGTGLAYSRLIRIQRLN
ncbi:hypothetical protein [Chishuiella changwenlii]|uniref:hypothetical protein n=1 Tax=Chishuiella changwenlii TaxID=1434701 RepID=UPI002FDA7256